MFSPYVSFYEKEDGRKDLKCVKNLKIYLTEMFLIERVNCRIRHAYGKTAYINDALIFLFLLERTAMKLECKICPCILQETAMAGEISAYALVVYVCLYVFFTLVIINLHVRRCYAGCLE